MISKRLLLILLAILALFFLTTWLTDGSVKAQESGREGNDQAATQEPAATPSPASRESVDRSSTPDASDTPVGETATDEAVSPDDTPSIDATSPTGEASPVVGTPPSANTSNTDNVQSPTPEPTSSLSYELTIAGWMEIEPDLSASNITIQALNPINCAVLSSPVVGYEISKGQDSNDITGLSNDLIANGFNAGTVDISTGPIPPCVDVLIVQGASSATINGRLLAAYTAAEATLLRNWAAAGRGLMISGEFGTFLDDTQPLFQAYGYDQQGPNAVGDPTNFDASGPLTPPNSWVIYNQTSNFTSPLHPILNGITSFELLASSWLSPGTNAIITTDGVDANPPSASVMAAFTDGAGCVTLTADSNWNTNIGGVDGYSKEDNATVARQMVQWLNTCSSLSLTKTAAPNPVLAGQQISYTLTARNNSQIPLTNVLITDTVPANTSFIGATSPSNGPNVSGLITWPVGVLNVNSSATVTMVVQVNSGVITGTLITNTARVGSNEGLTDIATTVNLVGNLLVNPQVIKTVVPGQAQPGDIVTFTLTVQQQAGNMTATNVQIVDSLPDEVDLLSVQATTGFATTTGRTVTWAIPALGPIDIGLITFRTRVNSNASPPPLTFINQARLSFDQGTDRLSNQVSVFVPGIPIPPPPPPAPDRGDDDDDDDDGGSAPSLPAPATPVPFTAFVDSPTATPVLPVLLLPETGSRGQSGAEWAWLIAAMTLLLTISIIARLLIVIKKQG